MPEVPEPWATAMVDRGFTDRRTKVPRPSARALAEAAGVHATTVLAMVGGAASDPRSVQAVADALGLAPETVSGWIDPTRLVSEPWVPPDEARLLGRRQREALDELIRAMAAQRKAGEGSGEQPAAKTEGSSDPAPSNVTLLRPDEPVDPYKTGQAKAARKRPKPPTE